MKLIVGLGNPGRKYQGTRHNVGYEVLAELARRHGTSKPKANFQGEVVEADLLGERALLLAPHTFMNRSGASVVLARDFYKLANQDLLVVCDDFNLPLGRLRIRAHGSAGGQNGLKDIIRSLGSEDFARLRVGIGPTPGGWDPADFVLGRFTAAERKMIEVSLAQAADAAVYWASRGVAAAMNQFNAKPNEEE